MDLLLVRHGLAGEADPALWPDDDARPLTAKGRKSFKRAARGLAGQGILPERIYASPARRTMETAAILAKALGLKGKDIIEVPALHHSRDPLPALSALARLKPPRAAAVVGHEPWLGTFLALLLGCDRQAEILFAKGGAGLVEIPDGAVRARGRGALKWLLTQAQLSGLG